MGGNGRLELRVTFGTGLKWLDAEVGAGAGHTVGELAELAAERMGVNRSGGLWCERRGEYLEAHGSLARSGIRWGDRLLFAPVAREPTSVGGPAQVEMVVTGGPCVGQAYELGLGAYRLGREPTCDICLPDPSLSRHHLDVRVDETGVSVADAGSSNGTALNGQTLVPRDFLALRDRDELELGRTLIRFRPVRAPGKHGVAQQDGRLDFNRPPRVSPPAAPFARELPAPPSRGRKARLPLASALVPLALGLLLFFLLKSPVMLAVAGLSPMMAITTYIGDRRGGRKSFARGSAGFRAQLEDALEDLERAMTDEALARRAESPDAPRLLRRLADMEPSLWERRPQDPDFLCLRVGVADLPARSTVTIKDGGDAQLQEAAAARISERHTIPSIPLTVNVRQSGVLGLAGPGPAVAGLARWLAIQAAVLHSPGELVMTAAFTGASAREWSWLKWLPHLRPDRVGMQTPPVAVGRAQTEALIAELRDLVLRRRAQAHAAANQAIEPVQLLVLIDEGTQVDRALLSAALHDAADHGIAVIWLGGDRRNLPGQTGAIVEIEQARAVLSMTDVSAGRVTEDSSAEALPLELAERSARLLAPIRDVSELARAGDIPRQVGLLDLLDLLPPTPEALQRRWEQWRGELCATVGVGADGPMALDLRNEGPHALIAGTTGSGKSELLRTFVASAAAAAPPNRLSFLLVDYKGGAAFAPCAALPHVVDIVSDLDEHLAERALIALNAELKRRERILAELGAKDLLELMRRDLDAAPPLLVIAVDEFAKLREEVPEFVDGVVDIAQRGRSLGVHMVLAAQTLRNAFTPAIRANTNLRLALRVAEEAESEDMISSPLAARIPSGESFRGRAFARTGHGELREFQAAYVSGRSDAGRQSELLLTPFELDGAVASERAPSADSDADSDLVALGEAARQAQQSMRLPVPVPPWLPMLPTLLSAAELESREVRPGCVAIGLVDLPHLQRQEPLVVDLEQTGHVAVFGAGNSGKTTVLTSIALALAQSATPEELCIYGLDAAGGKLAPLSALAHCGGVVSADEEERVQRLLGVLLRRIEGRDAGFGRHGAGFGGQGPGSDGPAKMVLLLDDLGSFAHQYERVGLESPIERLQRIFSGGRPAGVHVVLTASRRGALAPVLAAHVGQRLVLRLPAEEDMLALGLDSKTIRGARLPAGRGFTQDSHEFQIAVPAHDGVPIPLKQAAGDVPGERAASTPAIATLPVRVDLESLPPAQSVERLPIGLADEDLGTATVDLADMHLLVVGPYRSGRSTALATLARAVRSASASARVHLMAPRRSPLRDLELWDTAATTLDACAASAASLTDTPPDGLPTFVFVDDGGELSDAMLVAQLERLVRIGRDSSLRVIAAVETGAARGIANSWIRDMRREGHGLLLAPDLTADGDLLAARLPRRVSTPPCPGRGFLIARGSARLIQVAC